MPKTITLLGSTGSIGTQSLDVARMHGYRIFGLAANSRVEILQRQIEEFHPEYVAVVDPAACEKLDAALAGTANAPKLLKGPEGLRTLAAMDPETKERMSFTAPLPEDMLNLLNKLRNTPSMQ